MISIITYVHIQCIGIGIYENELRIDMRARPATSYQHCLSLFVNYFCIFKMHVVGEIIKKLNIKLSKTWKEVLQ